MTYIVERLRNRNAPYGWLELADKAADEIERLQAAGEAAFYAMCAYRDSPDEEVFQDAIDALGAVLTKDTSHERTNVAPDRC